MLKKFICTFLVAILVITSSIYLGSFSSVRIAEAENVKPNVIPSLREWTGGTGTFTMIAGARICVDPSYYSPLSETAAAFKEDITAMNGYTPSIVSSASPAAGDFFLTLNCNDNGLGDEGYLFETASYVTIRALNKTGVFYGTRTALQIMVQSSGKNVIPQGTARDYPKWKSRGFMLDVGRMPFSYNTIKDYVKFMAYYKMNDFQLHLNDNAWVDSNDWTKTYAAFRLDSSTYPGLSAKDLYYTKAQFRDLQDTARKYSLNIVPEIDSPAHSAAFTEYRPDLVHPTSKDFLNLANPDTYTFIDGLWNEFLPEFDSPIVHIGTDEYDQNAADSFKQYINHTNGELKNKGKKARMWGSLGQMGGAAGVDRDIIVDLWSTYWYNPQTAIADGYKIINAHDNDLYIVPKATYYHDYLDCKYLYENWEPYKFGGTGYDLSTTEPNLLGGKFCVWNDNLGHGYDIYDVYDRVKPAMQTLSEKLWSGSTGVTYDTFFSNSLKLGNAPGTALEYSVIQGNGNLAAGKTAYTSSVETGTTFTPNKAFDGRINTRWASAYDDNAWIYVDLGSSQTINRVILNWEAAYAKAYKIEISNDQVNWTQVYATSTGDGGIDDINFTNVSARFVRMQGVQRVTNFGYSLYEMQVLAPSDYGVTGATASSVESGTSFTADKVYDGSLQTRWSSQNNSSSWIYVDLGQSRSVNRVRLNWEAAYGKSYKIQVSNDAVNWTDVYSTTSGDGGIDEIIFNNVSARYVKMQGVQKGTSWGYSLWEFEVYGPVQNITSGSYYKIVNVNSRKALDIPNASILNGEQLQQWEDNGTAAQQWKIDDMGNGYYKLTAKCSGKVADIDNASSSDNTKVQQWDDNGTDAQRWMITDMGGGIYALMAKCSGKVADVYGWSMDNGGKVVQWSDCGGPNQRWYLIKIQ